MQLQAASVFHFLAQYFLNLYAIADCYYEIWVLMQPLVAIMNWLSICATAGCKYAQPLVATMNWLNNRRLLLRKVEKLLNRWLLQSTGWVFCTTAGCKRDCTCATAGCYYELREYLRNRSLRLPVQWAQVKSSRGTSSRSKIRVHPTKHIDNVNNMNTSHQAY